MNTQRQQQRGMEHNADRKRAAIRRMVGLSLLLLAAPAAQGLRIPIMGGDAIDVPLVIVDPNGTPQPPPPPQDSPFHAPTIFSAPLPSGSGARALGIAGAFTAVADDATAASWNPAGLTQLERPEFSLVYRLSHERDHHWSSDSNYRVGEDDYSANSLNYLSAVMPFRLLEHNAVCSLNYQEVFDFSQRYHASFRERLSRTEPPLVSEDNTQTDLAPQPISSSGPGWSIDGLAFLTITKRRITQDQTLTWDTLSDMEFRQEGSVQAVTPSFAYELTPKVSLGASLNVYQSELLGASPIRSMTRAHYVGSLDSSVHTEVQRTLNGRFEGDLVWNALPFNDITLPIDEFTDDAPPTPDQVTRYGYKGTLEIDDRLSRFQGVNATLGTLWTASSKLTLGFCLDLPWTARARQTKTTFTEVEVTDAGGAPVSTGTGVTTESKNVTFDFPLYWATGAAWRWTDRLTTSLDVSQTWWSDYSFKADGESRKNPLDGSNFGEHPLDDCWSLRTGTEYLWVLKRTEIPLRGGLSWEQRPAIGRPDEYWGISLGTGISIGKGPNKVIIDVAYTYSWGNDVMGSLVPGQSGTMGTDVQRHDVYISCIYHF